METIKWHTDIFIISVNLLSGNKYKLVLRISLQNNKSTEWIQLAVSVDCTSRIQFFFCVSVPQNNHKTETKLLNGYKYEFSRSPLRRI